MSECYSEKLDELLENKKQEIDTIYKNKFEKKNLENDDEKKEVLNYDVKKILGKQKTHQNKLDMELNHILNDLKK